MKPCLSVAHFLDYLCIYKYAIKLLNLVCYGIIHSTVVILHSYKLNYFINQRVIIITKKRLYLTLAFYRL